MRVNNSMAFLFPPFRTKVHELISVWNSENETQVGLFEGYRSHKRQAELYAMGRTTESTARCIHRTKSGGYPCANHPWGLKVTNARPGDSMHNYGLGSDILFDGIKSKPGLQPSWDDKHPWKKLGKLGQSLGLEWAGAWRSFPEMPHFQMTLGMQLSEMKELYAMGGIQRVWDELRGLIPVEAGAPDHEFIFPPNP
jgi:peptidoglycan L-alanyl-D-glutamate endopeptidase CwlK